MIKIDNNDVDCLVWPSQSPDLNIIENIYRLIKIRLELEQHTTHSKVDLVRAATRILYAISSVCISSLYQSLPRQIRHVIKARGHVTKY